MRFNVFKDCCYPKELIAIDPEDICSFYDTGHGSTAIKTKNSGVYEVKETFVQVREILEKPISSYSVPHERETNEI